MKTRSVAIVPARGGSKRIPHKNIVELCGKPLIAWTIEAAQESGLFERILVSTDDPAIAEVSRAFGAEVPFLRDQAADDQAPASQATIRALDQLEQELGERYDVVAQLMPNCPLRRAGDIRQAFAHFTEVSANFQISCFKFGWMNPWWAVTLDERGLPTPLFRQQLSRRSQDLETLYCPTGAIWLAQVEALREAGTFYGEGHLFHPLSWKAALDIDDYEDLEMAIATFQTMPPACM